LILLEDFYCSKCGEHIETKLQNKNQESCTLIPIKSFPKTINYLNELEKSKNGSFSRDTLALILACFFGCVFIISSIYVIASDPHIYANISYSQTEAQKEKNIQICEQIVSEYNESHIYMEGIYDCGFMAQDVWDMLKAKGINARIAVGDFKHGTESRIEDKKSIHQNIYSETYGVFTTYNYTAENGLLNSSMIDNLTHAWVLAEVSPGNWLAIECTGGYVVSSEDDKKYYQGLTFSTPEDYRSFLDIYFDWKNQIKDYEKEQSCYNELLKTYNSTKYSDNSIMRENVESEKDRLIETKETFLETDSKLQALLRNS
jgi:hypothetical protein